jgi:hypothetical protein
MEGRGFLLVIILSNNMNNLIIIINNDKNKILIVRMLVRHCQWRFENVPLTVTSFFHSFVKKKKRTMPLGVVHSHRRKTNKNFELSLKLR